MSQAKQASPRRRRRRAVPALSIPVLSVAGLSLSLASGIAAAAPAAVNPTLGVATSQTVALFDEEIADVSLATFHVVDKENAGTRNPRARIAMGCGGGCGGCLGGCGGCWAGSYETRAWFDDGYAPRPLRPAHDYGQPGKHKRGQNRP